MPRLALILEFLAIFVAMPLAYRYSPRPLPALPLLWLAALYCYWQLRNDASFDRRLLWNASHMPPHLVSILAIFLLVSGCLWMGVRLFAPELLFGFVRTRPILWALVMVLYPVLSVYPQGIIYRSFLMHRYTPLLPSTLGLIIASACAFAFMHIIFRNPLSVALTFFGGLLFAWRYNATGSLFTSSFEHALYGCWLFTVGLGQYFYHGTFRMK